MGAMNWTLPWNVSSIARKRVARQTRVRRDGRNELGPYLQTFLYTVLTRLYHRKVVLIDATIAKYTY